MAGADHRRSATAAASGHVLRNIAPHLKASPACNIRGQPCQGGLTPSRATSRSRAHLPPAHSPRCPSRAWEKRREGSLEQQGLLLLCGRQESPSLGQDIGGIGEFAPHGRLAPHHQGLLAAVALRPKPPQSSQAFPIAALIPGPPDQASYERRCSSEMCTRSLRVLLGFVDARPVRRCPR